MQNIKLRSHVGSDGILHLQVPVGVTDAEVEVTMTLQTITPAQDAKTPEELGWSPGFFERTFGSIPNLKREPQGELQEREPCIPVRLFSPVEWCECSYSADNPPT